MTTKIQVRRDTAANWTAANPVLSSGEIGVETDTQKMKTGNGVTSWTSLIYTGSNTGSGSGTQGATGAQGATGSGTQGAQGATGSGTQGAQGATGSGTQGVQGVQGPAGSGGSGSGAQGAQGIQGTTGTTSTDQIKAISIPSPTSSDIFTIFYTKSSATLTKIESVLRGSSTPSATFTVKYGSDRSTGTAVTASAITVTSVTTGLATTSFSSATIPAGNFVWIEVSAVSGTVDELSVTLQF
jgi:hypothetical protein